MANKTEQEPVKKEYFWVYITVVIALILTFSFFNGLLDRQKEMAQLEYEASITPEERQTLQEAREVAEREKQQLKQNQDEQNTEFWRKFMIEPAIPLMWLLGFIVVSFAVGIMTSPRRW